jgi:hypothetical protein
MMNFEFCLAKRTFYFTSHCSSLGGFGFLAVAAAITIIANQQTKIIDGAGCCKKKTPDMAKINNIYNKTGGVGFLGKLK